MKLAKKPSLFLYLSIPFLCAGGFWLGIRTVSTFSSQKCEVGIPPSEALNQDALRAIARRGFVFEHDIEQGRLKNAEFKSLSQTLETNLRNVLIGHPVKRELFHVTLQRSIVIPGGTPEQVETYRRLMVESERAISPSEKQAIEEKKQRVLAGARVAPIVQTSSCGL